MADHVCDLLGPPARAKAMFGGWGIYAGAEIIAIVHDETLYAKVPDEDERARFEAEGGVPFQPRPNQTMRSYWSVPTDALDHRDALAAWLPLLDG
ncbi:MAG: TfoX/Sxy family protein [Actinomycetota bacterium]|nr:TfoX/Sxy family protein [Actinomycetota bacterium]